MFLNLEDIQSFFPSKQRRVPEGMVKTIYMAEDQEHYEATGVVMRSSPEDVTYLSIKVDEFVALIESCEKTIEEYVTISDVPLLGTDQGPRI